MKYFRFIAPDYALIAANSEEEALKLYRTYVCPQDADIESNNLIITFETDKIEHLKDSELRILKNGNRLKPQIVYNNRLLI